MKRQAAYVKQNAVFDQVPMLVSKALFWYQKALIDALSTRA
jgi:hypothetical protein